MIYLRQQETVLSMTETMSLTIILMGENEDLVRLAGLLSSSSSEIYQIFPLSSQLLQSGLT